MKHIILLAAIFMLCPVNLKAAVINVSTVEELQIALDTASSNGQDDIINIAAGHYDVKQTLSYILEEQYSISIRGAGIGQTILDGGKKVQILFIDSTGTSSDFWTTITLSDVTFQNGNIQKGEGGGAKIDAGFADVKVERCAFKDNEAIPIEPDPDNGWLAPGGGGGLSIIIGAEPTASGGDTVVKECLFLGNKSTYGGGLYIHSKDEFRLKTSILNNIFNRNTAFIDGGAIWLSVDLIPLTNNTIINNSAEENGGGVYFLSGIRNDIFNNVMWNNDAGQDGADLYFNQTGYNEYTKIFYNIYSDIFFLKDNLHSEGNNLSETPNLDENFNPVVGSKCINSGDNSAPGLPKSDFYGHERIFDGIVDRGATEYGSTSQPSDDDEGTSNNSNDIPNLNPTTGGSGGCFLNTIRIWKH